MLLIIIALCDRIIMYWYIYLLVLVPIQSNIKEVNVMKFVAPELEVVVFANVDICTDSVIELPDDEF